MKSLLFAAAALAVVVGGAPALAQGYGPSPESAADPSHDLMGQLEALRMRVKLGLDEGQLRPDEANNLYKSVDRIRAIAESDRDKDGRLSPHARVDIQGRIDDLSRSIHFRRAENTPPPPPMAAAPPPPPPVALAPEPQSWTLGQREDWLAMRIDRGLEDHRLSGREADRGRQELGAIRSEQARLNEQDGGALSAADRTYLLNRIDQLNGTLRWEGKNPPAPWMGL